LPTALADLLNLMASGLWLTLFLFAAIYRNKMLDALRTAVTRDTNTPYILRASLEEMQRVNTHVESLLYTMKADRVCVFQFLNGQTFALADHAWKVTCTVERHLLTAHPIAGNNQGVHVSLLSDFLAPLLLPDVTGPGVTRIPVCAQAGACQDNFGGMRKALRFDMDAMPRSRVTSDAGQGNVRVMLAVPLLHKQMRQAIGFLVLQYEADDGRADVAQESMCLVCRSAGDIEELLIKGSEVRHQGFWGSVFSPERK
jgi:hypothetical protein